MKRLNKGVKRGMKRFVARKKRASRFSLTGDVTSIKVEEYGAIYCNAGTDVICFSDTSQNYYPLYVILQNSSSWTTHYPLYARYKIYGCSITLAPSRGTSLPGQAFGAVSGVPEVCVSFHPNTSGTSLGSQPIYNDRRLLASSNISQRQSKFWRFPNNFYMGNAFGLGTWNQCAGYANQTGQLSTCMTYSATPSTSTSLMTYCVTLYIQLSDKSQ